MDNFLPWSMADSPPPLNVDADFSLIIAQCAIKINSAGVRMSGARPLAFTGRIVYNNKS
jgi:hypothetical protein